MYVNTEGMDHDQECESEFIEGAYAWTSCGCAERQEKAFQLVFKGMFAHGFDAVDRMRGNSLSADDASTQK